MALYLVGDVQGCFTELKALLEKVHFNRQHDELWLTGDLVARGPDSLSVLRFIKSLGASAKFVLGNHDLHLLAIHAGIKKAKKSDHLQALLDAPDREELINWLAQQPLVRQLPDKSAYMSHAGLAPQWSLSQALEQASIVQNSLSSAERNYWLSIMYGEQPNNWHDAHTAEEKFRYTINAFTRMRYCYTDFSLEFTHKDVPKKTNKNLIPWFDLVNLENYQWVFGHWASLMGQCSKKNIFALDTGCVWGHHMTILRWHDKKVFIESAQQL